MNLIGFRRATLADVVFMAGIMRRSYAKRDPYGIPFDYESTLLTVEDVVTRGVAVVGPQSCAGALLAQFPFNHRAIVATVVFWNFDKSSELYIFDALMEACRESGATHVDSAALGDNTGTRFYTARGLKLVEWHYLGEIEKACTPLVKV